MDDAEIQKEISRLQGELKQREADRADIIQDHISAARAGVPNGTNVRQPAFEEFLRAFERLYGDLKAKGVFEDENEKSNDN